ncbi:Qat anti-phage system TatD family nuclease QatD [Cellulosimicrobium marinum]|uniref:Qat anti-phage system TatD family nuclease QatD n=1 Tax=Cellulosimicrobium marinum TaxID=1638992 RepID=UPI001E5D5554|nr:Qat anti-phage system TatD family nuclease QatD [Cellulosimicrobium marinum]MCB7135801.1 TatD family hydrolase [Cellulosimicrobium marinum]
MIDFHCHLDLYPDPSAIAAEAQQRGVGVLSVTTTPAAWIGTKRLATDRPTIRTALGFHPQLAGTREHELALFDRHLPETRYVGEVGLDGSPEYLDSRQAQVRVFDHVLRSCSNVGGKVLSVHSRRAAAQVLDCLEQYPTAGSVILHWFSGSKRELSRAVDQGCWFSVGPAMLTGAKGRALVAAIPRSKILVETDGPFAQRDRSPLRPWDAALAVDALARLWESSAADAARRLRDNEMSLLRG